MRYWDIKMGEQMVLGETMAVIGTEGYSIRSTLGKVSTRIGELMDAEGPTNPEIFRGEMLVVLGEMLDVMQFLYEVQATKSDVPLPIEGRRTPLEVDLDKFYGPYHHDGQVMMGDLATITALLAKHIQREPILHRREARDNHLERAANNLQPIRMKLATIVVKHSNKVDATTIKETAHQLMATVDALANMMKEVTLMRRETAEMMNRLERLEGRFGKVGGAG